MTEARFGKDAEQNAERLPNIAGGGAAWRSKTRKFFGGRGKRPVSGAGQKARQEKVEVRFHRKNSAAKPTCLTVNEKKCRAGSQQGLNLSQIWQECLPRTTSLENLIGKELQLSSGQQIRQCVGDGKEIKAKKTRIQRNVWTFG